MVVFLMDLASERYVETKYGQQNDESVEELITTSRRSVSHRHPDAGNFPSVLLQNDDLEAGARAEVEAEQKGHQDITPTSSKSHAAFSDDMDKIKNPIVLEKLEAAQNQAYKQQIAAFLVLEFGVIFHSVSLGLKTYTNCRCLFFITGRHRSEPRCRWQRVFNPLSRTCLPSVFRRFGYRRSNVRYPLS
jgi:zinc transporter 1/2/3